MRKQIAPAFQQMQSQPLQWLLGSVFYVSREKFPTLHRCEGKGAKSTVCTILVFKKTQS